jgi:hypothetical protein
MMSRSKYSDSDIEAVKTMLDLRTLVAQDIGKSYRPSQTKWLVSSPFREDRHPSFVVSQNFAYDLSMCQGFDVFDYLQEMRGMSFKDVMEIHSPRDIKDFKKSYTPPEPEPFKSPFTASYYVKRFGKDKKKSARYMETRGFSTKHLVEFKIGYANISNKYTMLDGAELKAYIGRVSIPYRIGNDVHCVAMRLDTFDLKKRAEQYGREMIQVRIDLEARAKRKAEKDGTQPRDITDDDIIERLFGAKYKYLTGSKVTIFNGNTLLKQIGDSEYDFARRSITPELIIDEGALNAMTMHIHGIPSIANKDYGWSNMPLITERVGRINVPIHNDETKVTNSGKEFNPGLRYFEKHRDELGHLRVRGLRIPKEYSDVNEFWVKDPDGLKKWIDKMGLQRMWGHCQA